MIYDVTCESFKKRIQNRQQVVAVPAWMKHDENELRNQSLFTKFPIYIRHAMKTYYLLVYDIYNLKISSFYWYMIYYKPNAKIYNIRR